ncbi:MAG TPA: PAS domain-containing protein [Bryobacteraceae bacterium]|jgi:PAS domain S-box-containing protein|nr:PAS domain-containing protein [Bryobacteraceae bacterium]
MRSRAATHGEETAPSGIYLDLFCGLAADLAGAQAAADVLEIARARLRQVPGTRDVEVCGIENWGHMPETQRFGPIPESGHTQFLEDAAAVPLCGGDGAVLAVALLRFDPAGSPERDRHLLDAIGRQCGAALERARLRERLERKRAYLEATSDSVMAVDSDWCITYMNRRAQESAAHGRDLTGQIYWEAFPEAQGTPFESRCRAAMAAQRTEHFEGYYEPLQTWFEVHAYPDRGGLVFFFRDIGARKRYEQERETLIQSLRESEGQARHRLSVIEAVYESAPVGLCVLDRELRFARINRRLAEMNGVPAEAHIGRTIRDVVPVIADIVEEPLRHLIETGEPRFDVELSGTTPADPGMVRTWSENWVPLKDERGAVTGVSASAEEITGRKRIEEELRRSQEKLSLVIESTELGMFDADPQEHKVEWNAATKRHFGLPPDAPVTYETFLMGLHPDDRERMRRALDEVMRPESGGKYAAEYRTVGIEDGRERHISAWGRVHFDAEGRAVRFVGVTRDITESKRMEEQLRQTQKLESIGLLAAGVAHDFNNLLASIMGNASILQDELPEQSVPMAAAIVGASERAAELTRQLLAYAGKGRFVLQKIDISTAVRGMTELLHASIPRKVAIEQHLAPDLPPVEADPGQIHQIVMNLVLNAAEAIPENQPGKVIVRTATAEIGPGSADTDELTHAPIAPGRYVCLEVQDTGIGMDSAVRAHIFDPFFSTKFTGRGLGLPALAGIVRAHHGAVQLATAPGQGSTFRVCLPCADGREPEHGNAARPAQGQGSGTILVVDDESFVRDFMRAALERGGYRVLTAENGREAVEAVATHGQSIDLVLLDLVMPEMGGEEVAEILARTYPQLKLMLMSGYSEMEAERIFGGRPIASFLQKPFTAPMLLDRVQEMLRRTAPQK